MQAVNRHFYYFVAPKRLCQSKLVGHTYVCTFPLGDKFAKSVMLYDGFTQKARHIENPCLDVNHARAVAVNKGLFVFKYGEPVTA